MLAKRGLFAWLFTLFILSLAVAAPPAVHPTTGEPLVIDCLKGTPSAIDGDLSDWNLEAMIPAVLDDQGQLNSGAASWTGVDDCSAKFYLLWDNKNIYIGVVVKDDTVSTNKTGADIWNADCLEVFFSTLNTVTGHAEHYQYGFTANGLKWSWEAIDGAGSLNPTYMTTASTRTADGYMCETAIEYARISSLDFSVGNTIGFHAVIDDTDGTDREIQMTWTGREAHDQSLGYGYLNLSADAAIAPELSHNPNPANAANDVLRDSILSWAPGDYAVSHNVYLGDSFEDVNSATVATVQNLDVNSFDPGRFEFGKTYFWRVDEVNGTPDKTVFKGDIWSFTAEPYSIQIPGSSIGVVASSAANDYSIPENTINGSGLGTDNKHGIGSEAMWFTSTQDPEPWIQFEFDGIKKLDIMKVWNSNSSAEAAIGWGVKAVEILYSMDGENWDVLADANQFSRAPGKPSYNQYDEINFGGVPAKYVKFNILSNWGGILKSYSLSEVQFSMIPAAARTPVPEVGSVVLPNAVVKWRAGREADQHTIYVSMDANAVANGSAPSVSSNTNSLALSSLDLHLGETYYWRVDEVNDAEGISVWAGSVWSFSLPATLVVDDFESYTNKSPHKIFQTWLDGFGYSADDFFPVAYGGNGTGAGLGHDNWTPSSPYYGGDFMEVKIVKAGKQSMPFYYDNTVKGVSQIDRTWTTSQNWGGNGIKTLVLYFQGKAGNTGGPLYAKINGKKVTYPNNAALTLPLWYQWNIDLPSLGIPLSSVTSLNIGVDGSGSGLVLIDDIRLYTEAPEAVLPTPLSSDGLIASYNMENNVQDGSGKGNNGTLVGTPLYVPGHAGSALQFDGIGACVNLGNKPAFNPTGSFSVAVWANITDWTTDWGHVMVGNRGEDNVGWQLRRRNNNSISWTARGIGQDDDPSSSMDAPLNEWVHIVAVYDKDKSVKRLYVNGTLSGELATTPGAAITPSTHNTYIGARALANNTGPEAFFNGMLDDVLLYNRSLSEGEVRYMMGDR